MKKIHIASLFALAGMATAESLDYDTYKATTPASPYMTGLYTVWDFDQGAGTSAAKVGGTTGGYGNTPKIAYETGNTVDGYGVIDSTGGYVNKTNMGLNDFTVSVDINTMTVGHLLSLQDSNGKYICLTSSSATPLTLTCDDVTDSVESAVNPTTSDTTLNWTTITLTRSSNKLTLYVNGVSQGTLEGNNTSITSMQLGKKYPGGTDVVGIEATIDNLTIWNRALSAKEVAGFVVPEPTTATLSLLALVGLAACRRRK